MVFGINPGAGRGWFYDTFMEGTVADPNLERLEDAFKDGARDLHEAAARLGVDFESAALTFNNGLLKNYWRIELTSDDATLSVTEQALVDLATPLEKYGTITEALVALGAARKFQATQWPKIATADANGRSAEEWQLLINAYLVKLNQVYTASDGTTPAGRIRYAKYAALFANLALWLVQATVGVANEDKKRQAETVVHQFATEQEAAEARVSISTSLINGTVRYDRYTSGNDKPVDGHSYHYSPDAKAPVVENAGGGFQIVHE